MLVREKAKSVILIFILIFILLLLTASSLWMWRTTGMRHRLERRGSGIRRPWSVCAIQRCAFAAHTPLIGRSHAARIRPRRPRTDSSLLERPGFSHD